MGPSLFPFSNPSRHFLRQNHYMPVLHISEGGEGLGYYPGKKEDHG
jgi:hypothetical protein